MTDAESKLDLLMSLGFPCIPLLTSPELPEWLFGAMPANVHNVMLVVQFATAVAYGLLVIMMMPGIVRGFREKRARRREEHALAEKVGIAAASTSIADESR